MIWTSNITPYLICTDKTTILKFVLLITSNSTHDILYQHLAKYNLPDNTYCHIFILLRQQTIMRALDCSHLSVCIIDLYIKLPRQLFYLYLHMNNVLLYVPHNANIYAQTDIK